ncbi:MAG: DJ-1/PfpI family protein [Candidatus Peribacteraceae bacterium]|nr:DJ-1/PfpI family protein [Candidatus Peribacteraceae bacterium]MDD5074946.1 DJ-1/PfpI family protein [Candidatus Peribacteraceae bacterium]
MAKKALIIIAQQGYQDLEYEGVKEQLERAGIAIVVASAAGGMCKGKLGGSAGGTVALSGIRVRDFDAILFIGGPGAETYSRHPEALRIAHEAAAASMPLGAICIAPLILAKAQALDGRRATVWDSGGEQAAIIQKYGATYTGDQVTRDGLIVTGNGPEATEEFARTMLEVMRG